MYEMTPPDDPPVRPPAENIYHNFTCLVKDKNNNPVGGIIVEFEILCPENPGNKDITLKFGQWQTNSNGLIDNSILVPEEYLGRVTVRAYGDEIFNDAYVIFELGGLATYGFDRIEEGEYYEFIKEEPEIGSLYFKYNYEDPDPPERPDEEVFFYCMTKMEYSKPSSDPVRNDLHFMPDENEWDDYPVNAWIPFQAMIPAVDEDNFMGGKFTLYYYVDPDPPEQIEDCTIFEYNVRGLNPNEGLISDYIDEYFSENNDEPWFLMQLLRQESGLEHFNEDFNYNHFGPEWSDYDFCPKWGRPNGWGLTQRDVGDDTPLRSVELWNWKKNFDNGVGLLCEDKWFSAQELYNEAKDNWDTYNLSHTQNPIPIMPNITIQGYSFTMNEQPGEDEYSFRDGVWIKAYNGSSRPTAGNNWTYASWLEFSAAPLVPSQVIPYGGVIFNDHWVIWILNSNREAYVNAVLSQPE